MIQTPSPHPVLDFVWIFDCFVFSRENDGYAQLGYSGLCKSSTPLLRCVTIFMESQNHGISRRPGWKAGRERERERKKELVEINLNKFPIMGMGSGGMGTKSRPRRSNSGREHKQVFCWDRIHETRLLFHFFP